MKKEDRRFQKVTVEPPTMEQTVEILSNIRHKYEEHHSVSYDDNIIDLIVNWGLACPPNI